MPDRELRLSSEMMQAWCEGLTRYQPVYGNLELEAETGQPEASLRNLRKITKDLMVTYMYVGPHSQIFIAFTTGHTYLATGFAVGEQSGEMKVKCFAQFCSEIGLGNVKDLYILLSATESDYRGILTFPPPEKKKLRVVR